MSGNCSAIANARQKAEPGQSQAIITSKLALRPLRAEQPVGAENELSLAVRMSTPCGGPVLFRGDVVEDEGAPDADENDQSTAPVSYVTAKGSQVRARLSELASLPNYGFEVSNSAIKLRSRAGSPVCPRTLSDRPCCSMTTREATRER